MNASLPWLILMFTGLQLRAADNLVANGDFESGPDGWRVWSRTPNGIAVASDSRSLHSGRGALRLEHRGDRDWSLEPNLRLAVRPGDVVEMECWVKVQGAGDATLCASTWRSGGNVVAWAEAGREARESAEWQHLVCRFVADAHIVEVQPRLIGNAASTVWVDDFAVRKTGNLNAMRRADLAPTLALSNACLEVSFNTTDATLSVRDLRAKRVWAQKPFAADCVVQDAFIQDRQLTCTLIHAASGSDVSVSLRLDADRPEVVVGLAGRGELPGSLRFPHPFLSQPGDYLVVPLNEGISYPVDDPTISPLHLIAYGGHGICMAFYGVTDGDQGQMTILETADDASIRIDRLDGRLTIAPVWEPQRGEFGERRRLRFVFFEHGGHVAMAKRYRAYAQEMHRFKTLAEKRRENPDVDLLIGAVNVWCWDRDAVALVKEMQAAGIQRILWSNQQSPGNLRALNDLGVLTSRYDIYQDVMAATNFSRLQWIHPDWTSNAWPHDVIVDRRGQRIRGWEVEAKDGSMIPCGVICDRQALPYARERIPAELATHPYRCRFIDTTTAAPWHECYQADHPMTRTDSRVAKMELLRYVSEDLRRVTGCETGHDAAVPFLHYFEGMLSLGPYRVPDAGRRMNVLWTNVPPDVAKFQLGHDYRLPLWELVFHDCVVAQWYWGDYNNKLPSLWNKRDLFNVLYGVPPMFMFNRSLWEKERDRFVQSYRNTCPHVRELGYAEMTDHRFLTRDRSVQQTAFANGITVTVNFGDTPFRCPDGTLVAPQAYQVRKGS